MWLDRDALFKAAAGDLPKRVAHPAHPEATREMRPSGCVAGACGMHGWMSQIPYIESIWRAQAWRERVEVHLKVRARRLRTFRRCAKHPSHLRAGQCHERTTRPRGGPDNLTCGIFGGFKHGANESRRAWWRGGGADISAALCVPSPICSKASTDVGASQQHAAVARGGGMRTSSVE